MQHDGNRRVWLALRVKAPFEATFRGPAKMISGMEKPYTGMTGWFRAGLVSRAQLWARSGLAPEKRLNHAGVFLTFMI